MWQKIKEFSRKDPLIFTIILALVITGVGFASVQSMHMTSTAKFCKTCHPKEEIAVRGEYYTWRKSIHSEVDVSCLDCHGAPGIKGYMKAHVVAGMRSMYHEILTPEEEVIEHLTEFGSTVEGAMHAASEESCMFCHSDQANQEMRRNRIIKIAGEFRMMDEVVNPEYRKEYGRNDIFTEGVSAGVEPDHALHMNAGLSCFNCHLGVGHSGERFHKPKMETCFECHDEVRAESNVPANDDCATCHVAQKQNQEGTYAKGVEGDRWYMADLDCSDCHESAFVRPNTDKCVSCHGDAYYGEMMSETQNAFNAKLEKAQAVRDRLIAQREGMEHGRLELVNELHYLVRILENDGSEGIHNPEYFDMIFEKVAELETAVAEWAPPAEEDSHGAPAVHVEEIKEEHAEPAEEAHAGPVNSEELMSIIEGLEQIDLAERHVADPKKDAVIFEHKEHAERVACTSCHADPEAGQLKFEIGEVKGTNNVFHKELCIPCHKEEKVKTSCNTCHSK